MEIVFVTGNKDKYREAKNILKGFEIKQIDYDITEIQGTADEIIKDKIKKAIEHFNKPCMVEDTSLYIDGLQGLPGPYIKEFVKKLGIEGIFDVCKTKDPTAQAVARVAYGEPGKEPVIFTGEVEGHICKPSDVRKFGWDPIFKPKGSLKPSFLNLLKQESCL